MEPIWLAVQALAKTKDAADGERTISQETRPDGVKETITHMKPPSIEMAKFRADRAEKAVKDAMAAIFGDASRQALARMLADSLREDVGRMTDDEAVEMFTALEIPVALEFLGAFLEVNATVFRPLVQRALVSLKERFSQPPSPDSEGDRGAAAPTPAPSASD
jgi:hypothetical protein